MPELTAIPAVRDVPAADLKPGMRVQMGAPQYWQPPVSSVTTWGPGKDEAPSYPETWWTRVTVEATDRRHVSYYYTPSFPVRVVEQVACRGCGALIPVAEAVNRRRFDQTTRPPRFVEQFDLCPDCAGAGRALLGTLNPTKEA